MNEEFTDHVDTWYRLAEEKAAHYFASLYKQVKDKSYVPTLTEDFQLWKKSHIQHQSLFSYFSQKKRKPDSKDYHRYIQWMNYTGKLDDYLDRSVSYIYLRDLGKALDSPDTQTKIKRVVSDIKKHLIKSTSTNGENTPEIMSMANLYRWGQKEGIETDIIWVINKLGYVSSNLPNGMDAEHAQRKLIKIIFGVIINVFEEIDENTSPEERARRLGDAVRLGYSYGLTYPFIDDLLDSQILTEQEKVQYSDMLRSALLTGIVPELSGWSGSNMDLIHYIHSELREAFEYIRDHQQADKVNTFFEQSYVFFHSQEIDREKDLSHGSYSNEELFIPIILKSSSSRLIVRSVISAAVDEDLDQRTFYYGIYNQLADDFADMFDDMNDGAVTPYTYYLKYHDQRPDLINPFELYWSVIANLIHNVHHSDPKTCEVILDRAINGLKRCKERLGNEKYDDIMKIFASGNPEFNHLVQHMVRKADDVEFFDKLLRDQMVTNLKNSKTEKENFSETISSVRQQINNMLPINKYNGIETMDQPLIDAANYSLEGDAKRIRPILTWVMAVDEYGLKATEIIPLLRSLEYMHTASLIFDDLPSQDNASTRRGRPTVHQVHNVATAELTGLFLILRAIKEQTSLGHFNEKTVLAMMQYSAEKTEEMCMGQAMDLQSKGKALTLEQLNMMCFYKTGIAFEASLIMPALLAEVKAPEIAALKKFAYHAGIAFQIKDDLLDMEGDLLILGKPIGQDVENNNSTFVSILGTEGAKKEMWEHYCLAMESLNEMPRNIVFLKHLVNYMINRDR